MTKWSLERQILAGFLLALGVLLAVGILVYRSTVQFADAVAAADRSRQVLTALETIYSLVTEAESNQRAYIITGEARELAARESALGQSRRLTERLKQLLQDDPTQIARLGEMEQSIAERLRLLDWVLQARRDTGFEAARQRFLAEQGSAEMRKLRNAIAAIQASETERLAELQQLARTNANWTLASLVLLLVLSMASLSVLYGRVRADVRGRQRAQDELARQTEELRASETRLRTVVDTAIDGIVVIDERGIIDRVNLAAERMFGYRAGEMIGRNVSMLMPSPDRERHDSYLARYLAGGEPHIIGIGREVMARQKSGRLFPMDLAVSEMRVGGRRMFTGIVRDISERKRAEEQRTQLIASLESANEELKNFAYVVSHDLKAPLRAIGSLADWISVDYADRLDPEGQEHLALLKNRVRRMDGLIDGILEYSRVGRVREQPAAVDLNAVVRDTIDLLAPPAHVHIEVNDRLPTVQIEPTRIRQVFQNLVSNAVKYLDKPEGRVRIGCRELDGMWQFSVSDNGPGIEARHHERIFQLFQTLAPRDRVESTGVGLALVKKIVEMYGGRVWLESTPGAGSTFHFTLPRAPAARAAVANEGP